MKAAIVTVWGLSDNYGNVLQNFALQKYLSKKGIRAELLIFSHVQESSRAKRVFNKLKRDGVFSVLTAIFKVVCLRFIRNKNGKRNFSRFIDSNLNVQIVEYRELKELQEKLDYNLYIAGSDQVWNCLDSCDEEHFSIISLNYAPKHAKKISCAASFGCYENSFENRKQEICDALNSFDFVSVREKSGLEICRNLGIKDCVLQPDPTFLFDADFYRNFCSSKTAKIPNRKYVLLYLLNNDTEFSIAKFKNWAKKNGVLVVYVDGNKDIYKISPHKKTYPEIPEWILLIDNAEYVFTNSFHGCVFSLILNKPFLMLKQKGKFESQNVRFDTLAEQFKLDARFFSGNFDDVKKNIDWASVNNELALIRNESPFVKYMDDFIKVALPKIPRIPKISCIVPVYKVEKYINRCVDSILIQTFTDFELILVDDGSPDNSGKICDEYAKKDSRVKVVHKTNGGVSSARNVGLDAAKGEYICFVDSDDWVENNYFEWLYKMVKQSKCDVAVCGFFGEKRLKPKIFNNQEEVISSMFSRKSFGGFSNKKIISLKLINAEPKTRYDEKITYLEDSEFFYRLFKKYAKIYWNNVPLYHYETNPESVTMQQGITDSVKNAYNVLEMLIKNEDNKKTKRSIEYCYLNFRIVKNLIHFFRQRCLLDEEKKEFEFCKETLKKRMIKNGYFFSNEFELRKKILIFIMIFFPELIVKKMVIMYTRFLEVVKCRKARIVK